MYGQNNGYFMPNYNPYMMQANGAVPDMLNQAKMAYQAPVQAFQSPKIGNEMIWVLNENEATSYPVAPNNSVVLWDKSNPTVYVKSANAQGVPSIRILDFVERSDNGENEPKKHECSCAGKFPTIEQFNALKAKFYDLMAKYDSLVLEQEKQVDEKQKTTTKKSKGDEE